VRIKEKRVREGGKKGRTTRRVSGEGVLFLGEKRDDAYSERVF